MIVIKVELWPGGDESRRREISRMNLWNTGDHTYGSTLGDYEFVIVEPGAFGGDQTHHHGALKNQQRDRSVWSLVREVLGTIRFKTDAKKSSAAKRTKPQ
jgi:hypothetical protein